MSMQRIRVGYPAILDAAAKAAFPQDVDLVPLEDGLDHEITIDVWIPDPYQMRARRIWPHLRGVRLVLSLMAGTEWIPATVGPHVTICNAHGAHNIPTAEWTLSAILTLLKHFPLFLDLQRAANWRGRKDASAEFQRLTGDTHQYHPDVMQEELTGKSILLVGYGSIGQEIERLLAPFHVDLIRMARSARAAPLVHPVSSLNDLLPVAEVIILILPLTEESHGLIGPAQFALMRQGALLVNAARGPVLQTDALVDALNQGRIRAALDVTDPEPLPAEHPLWRCPNLLITPHVAASSPQFAARAFKVAAGELRRYIRGEPLHNAVQLAT